MSFPKTIVTIVLLSSTLVLGTARAQFGYPGRMALPQYDFTWTWGDEALARGSFNDLAMTGNESGFRCELNATMRVTSRLSRQDINQIENNIRDNLFFVQSASNMMYVLDSRGELGYATLECAKPEVEQDADEEKRAARETRARERAARERERRRARREREEAEN